MTARQIHSEEWKRGFTFALLGTALWGLTPTATKMALHAADPDVIAFARLAVAAVVFRRLAFLPLRAVLRNRWAWIAGTALGGDFLLYSRGLESTLASSAAVLVCVEPVVTIALAVSLLGERWNAHRALGSLLTLTGVVVAALHRPSGSEEANAATLEGNLLVVAAAVLWSIYAVAQRKTLVDHDWASRLSAIFVVASLVVLPFAASHPRLDWQAGGSAWAWFFVLVMLCTAAVYTVYAKAQRLVDVSVLSLLLAGIPVFSVVFAALLLKEPLGAPLLAAAVLVFGGSIVLATEPYPGSGRGATAKTLQSR